MNTGRDTSRSRLFSEPVWLMIHLVLLGIIILFAGLTAAYLIGPDAGEEAGFRIPESSGSAVSWFYWCHRPCVRC